MSQGAGAEMREGMRGAEEAGVDEFGAMESPERGGEGHEVSSPVVLSLDASLHATQLTLEHLVLLEREV